MKPLLFLTIIFFLSGCAFHSGMMTSNTEYIKPEYELKYTVKADAKTTRIFGIGGLGKTTLVAEAKARLYQYYPLRNEEAYANVSVDFWDFFLLFYHRTKATVTADIIGKVNASPEDTAYQSLFVQKKINAMRIGIFKVGDEVYKLVKDKPEKYTILDVQNDKVYLGTPSGEKVKKAKHKNLYLLKNDRLPAIEYEIFDTVKAWNRRKAKIIGLNENKVLVEIIEDVNGDRYFELPYDKIEKPEE